MAVPTDVASDARRAGPVEAADGRCGRIDTPADDSDTSRWCLSEELESLEPLERIMQVNDFGSVCCTHHSLPPWKRTQGRLGQCLGVFAPGPVDRIACKAVERGQ